MKASSVALAAFALSVAAPTYASTILEREFRYPREHFTLRQAGPNTEVFVTGATRETRPGRPDLPLVSERVDLPQGTRVVSVEVVAAEPELLSTMAYVPPAIRIQPDIVSIERTEPDPTFYARAGLGQEPAATLGYQGSERGRNVALLTIRPVRWDPVSGRLERVARIRVRITLEPFSDPDVVPRLRIVREWEDALPTGVPTRELGQALVHVSGPGRSAQPFKATQIPSVLGSPVAYVIITGDALASAFQPLADWKTQAGVPAVVRTLSFIRQEYPFGADDADRIRQFIRDAYSRWGTKYVLLGGDTDVIPTRYAYTTFFDGENIATDMYFSCLDGNWNADGDSTYGEGYYSGGIPGDYADLMPEVYVGRAPVSTPAQVSQFVAKTFQYTRTPLADYENRILWFAEVLFPQDWAPGQATSLDGAELCEEDLPYVDMDPAMSSCRLYQNYTDSTCATCPRFRWRPGALPETRQAVLDSLSVGYGIAVHEGHGYRNVMSVGDGGIGNGDVLALTNGNRLFNLYSSNCTSNAIDFPSIGEAFLHAANGGAVSNIGCTRYDFPTAAREFQKEFFRLLFEDSVTSIGELQAKQKLPFVGFSAYDGVNRWVEMSLLLLGDPELNVWMRRPQNLAVTFPSSMVVTDTTLTVDVKIGAAPLAGALVTAYRPNDELRSVTTDAAGNALIDFRPDTTGSLYVTVTAHDCRPAQAVVPITAAVNPLLVESAPLFDDDNVGGTLGNGNGIPESGETVDMQVPVRNNGGANALGVSGTLSTTDGMVTIMNPSVTYGTVASSPANPGAPPYYRFMTLSTTPDQREIPFTLNLQDANGKRYIEALRVTIKAPELRHFTHSVTEISGGNGNGRPDPGETVTYTVKLKNLGKGTASNVTAVLRQSDGKTSISDSTASFGTIVAGAQVSGDPFTFSVFQSGAKLELRVTTSQGLALVQPLDLTTPASPSALALRGSTSSITLTWLHNPESDIAGYNIWRSSNAGGPFNQVNLVPTDRTSYYQDEGLAALTIYYYQVSAVDSSGNESGRTPVSATSTNPPSHAIFPLPMGGNSPAPVAVGRTMMPNQQEIFAGAEVLYAWRADGTALADADGSTATYGDFCSVGTYYAAGPTLGDLDGGGFEVVAPAWNSLSIYAFDLQGNLKPGWPFYVGSGLWSTAAIIDLNLDGQKEVLFGSNSPYLYALRSNGTEWMNGDGDPGTVGVFKNVGGGDNYGTPALAPLEGGNVPDIIYGSNPGVLYAWRPDGTNLPGFPITLGGKITGSVAVGRLDGPSDASPEIVVTTGKDSLYVFKATGARQPGFPVYVPVGGTSKQPSPALADVNNDGFADIVIASTNGRIYVFDHNGVLLPAFANVRYSTLTGSATESSPVVADINGDALQDIVVGDENGQLTAIGGNGQQLPGFPIQLGGEVRGTPALCDCDGDGMTEIVIAGWDGNVYAWDYDFPFSPAGLPGWPQFHHDAMRTGHLNGITFVGVPPVENAPARLEFALPFPNPTRTDARLDYAIPADHAGQEYRIEAYDLAGRLVRVIAAGRAQPGRGSVRWDLHDDAGHTVNTGIYFVRMSLGAFRQSRKLVLIP